jgi:hypothetical protein
MYRKYNNVDVNFLMTQNTVPMQEHHSAEFQSATYSF